MLHTSYSKVKVNNRLKLYTTYNILKQKMLYTTYNKVKVNIRLKHKCYLQHTTKCMQ